MPRSCSSALVSMLMPSTNMPVCRISASVRAVLPWSTWAMMAILRISIGTPVPNSLRTEFPTSSPDITGTVTSPSSSSLDHHTPSEPCELVGGADQCLGEARVAGAVARVVNDHELGAWPHALELPRVGDRRLKVKAAVHQCPGDSGQRAGVAE